MESLTKKFSFMRVIKLKEIWSYDNSNLVINNRITVEGLSTYWQAIDAAVRFNVQKHEVYLARSVVEKHNNNNNFAGAEKTGRRLGSHPKDMKNFFAKKHKMEFDRFHWNRKGKRQDRQTSW